MTNFTGPSIESRRIATGPDGALWFTNRRQQLDRADHHRRDGHELHRPGIADPDEIAAGPDGALWFTNYGNNSIGRITTRGRSRTSPTRASTARTASRRGRTAPCGSPTRQRLDRADHDQRGGHELHRPELRDARSASRPGRTARCGSPTRAQPLDRTHHHGRSDNLLRTYPDRDPVRNLLRAGRGAVVRRFWHFSIGQLTLLLLGGSPARRRSQRSRPVTAPPRCRSRPARMVRRTRPAISRRVIRRTAGRRSRHRDREVRLPGLGPDQRRRLHVHGLDVQRRRQWSRIRSFRDLHSFARTGAIATCTDTTSCDATLPSAASSAVAAQTVPTGFR